MKRLHKERKVAQDPILGLRMDLVNPLFCVGRAHRFASFHKKSGRKH